MNFTMIQLKRHGYVSIRALLVLMLFLTGCSSNQMTSTAIPIQTIIVTLPTPVPVQTPTLTRAQWDTTKIAILEGTEQERQTRVASGTPFASTPIPLTQVMPVTTPPMGISGGCFDPSRVYRFSNCWNGKLNDEYIFVAALVKKADPMQGILRVYTTTVGISHFGPVGWYNTPTQSGAIEIVDAASYRLTLHAEDNTFFSFDVLARQWVTPSTTPAPSPVPSLPPTP